ncbi:MAG: fructose-1,6-bisphosphatase [Mediterranea sp.]|jgi:fructose-1,6-bisphosphatase-3|nr:fructose-1,6-bisphosphatase [Mediterranea sp.]
MSTQSNITPESIASDLRYLQLLSRSFPTVAEASTEIINLEAILNLPKGTEHFLTDVHGEYEAFQHVLKNASGNVKRKVNEIFANTLRDAERKELCTLIYYPEEKLQLVKAKETDLDDWYLVTLNQLVKVCQNVSSKYTRSKVRKSLPAEFSYIIQELLHESSVDPNKHAYIDVIFTTIISTRRADDFIVALCNLIQRLIIDSLHIVGDIYDRGPGAHIIMDTLCDYHNFDIQWGNHDILWMGAASGNDSCIAGVIRMAMRYGNLATLEEGYGINLLPLATFAMETYGDDPCDIFVPKVNRDDLMMGEKTLRLITQMHKAITIIQLKLEAAIIDRRPDFGMADRKLLHRIDRQKGTLVYGGKEYALRDTNFPTVDPDDPYRLTDEERELVDKLHASFMNSEKLKKHIRCLFAHGSMYLVVNSNLLYHASVPLNEDGSFKHVMVDGGEYWGRRLLDKADQLTRIAYFGEAGDEETEFAKDYVWYLWCGADAPLFDKDKMATFERYFVADKELHKEKKGCYYTLRNQEEVCDRILDEFGATGLHAHIINGHVPVKTIKGEQPTKAGGKLFVIDGGFSKAYQPETGIAGYTLVYHSRGMQLVQHEPFLSRQKAIEEGQDIKSTNVVLELSSQRMMVSDTDKGKELETQIQDLKKLLVAYRIGLIKEKGDKIRN